MNKLFSAAMSAFLALGPAQAWSRPPGLQSAFGKHEFRELLQRFVNEQYMKGFRRLGEEADFDHGHLLFDAKSPGRPVAILYHTQELSGDASLDRKARNWLQWVGSGKVQDAALYQRKEYPHTASWDWFLHRDLPVLRERHTILDKMLDPALLRVDALDSRQWVFTRVECRKVPPPPDTNLIQVTLPAGPTLCLALSES